MLTLDMQTGNADEQPLEYNSKTIQLTGEDYRAKVLVDSFNTRIKVQRHQGPNILDLIKKTLEMAREGDYTKISFLAREDEWETFLSRGFVLEAILKGYYQGDDGYIMARFIDPKRRYSERLEEENRTIEEIVESPVGVELPRLGEGLTLREARVQDAKALARMYKRVFASYPTPIFDEEYLANEIREGMIYKVIWAGNEPVSASSADIDEHNRSAELTDCGTIPEYRGQGLITLLIHDLEEELRRRNFSSFYGMARALSYGMNLIFQRFGYHYRGRLINHGHISGHFEDLNVWVKELF